MPGKSLSTLGVLMLHRLNDKGQLNNVWIGVILALVVISFVVLVLPRLG